jgi:hypothetical protein
VGRAEHAARERGRAGQRVGPGLADTIVELCSMVPTLSIGDVLDMDYDQIERLREAALRRRHVFTCDIAQGVAFGIGLAFGSIKTLPTWEELKARAQRLEEFRRSPFVQRGRYGHKEPGTQDIGARPD